MIKTLASKLMAAKVMAAVAGVTAIGGAGLAAASSGHLPSPLPHSSQTAPASTTHEQEATEGSGTTQTPEAISSPSGEPEATPSPSMVGLCHAWLARPSDAGKAADSPAFGVLVTAAGGSTSVNTYCATLLTTSTSPAVATSTESREDSDRKPAEAPGDSTHRTGERGDSTHPAGEPGDSTHPAGVPTAAPNDPMHSDGERGAAPGDPSHSTGDRGVAPGDVSHPTGR
jgi:hypothetical protein